MKKLSCMILGGALAAALARQLRRHSKITAAHGSAIAGGKDGAAVHALIIYKPLNGDCYHSYRTGEQRPHNQSTLMKVHYQICYCLHIFLTNLQMLSYFYRRCILLPKVQKGAVCCILWNQNSELIKRSSLRRHARCGRR